MIPPKQFNYFSECESNKCGRISTAVLLKMLTIKIIKKILTVQQSNDNLKNAGGVSFGQRSTNAK